MEKTCCLLIGAGCSVSAGIPSASAFVDIVRSEHRTDYCRALDAARAREPDCDVPSYFDCMAELSPRARLDLLATHADASGINWAHLGIASLMQAGFVDRALTTNFDPLIERACAYVGVFSGVYDLALGSGDYEPSYVSDPSVVHLHGRRYGFNQLMTQDQMRDEGYQRRIQAAIADANDRRLWIVVGYGGAGDHVFDALCSVAAFHDRLVWVGYGKNAPSAHVSDHLLRGDNYAHYLQGADPDFDADTFFIDLCLKLHVFPPRILSDPHLHLRDLLESLPGFPVPSASERAHALIEDEHHGLFADLPRTLIAEQIEEVRRQRSDEIRELGGFLDAFMRDIRGWYEDVISMHDAPDIEPSSLMAGSVSNSYFQHGTDVYLGLTADGSSPTVEDYALVCDMFRRASELQPDSPAIYNHWGLALRNWARLEGGREARDALFTEATHRLKQALDRDPSHTPARANLGTVLEVWAETTEPDDPERAEELFQQALDAHGEAARRDPGDFSTHYGIAHLLVSWSGRQTDGERRRQLLVQANKALEEAARLNPDHSWIQNNWGITFLQLVDFAASDHEKDRMLRDAIARFRRATDIANDHAGAWMNMGIVTFGRSLLAINAAERHTLIQQALEHYAHADMGPSDNAQRLYLHWSTAKIHESYYLTGTQQTAALDEAWSLAEKGNELSAGSGSYNLACISALQDRPHQCRSWLEHALQHGHMLNRRHLAEDRDLRSVRELPWFQRLLDETPSDDVGPDAD